MTQRISATLALAAALGALVAAQPLQFSDTVRTYIKVDAPVVEIVFKQGVGFDPVKLIDSVRGKAGLW